MQRGAVLPVLHQQGDEDPKTIVCMFTLSNDSIRVDVIPNNRGRKLSQDIPHLFDVL